MSRRSALGLGGLATATALLPGCANNTPQADSGGTDDLGASGDLNDFPPALTATQYIVRHQPSQHLLVVEASDRSLIWGSTEEQVFQYWSPSLTDSLFTAGDSTGGRFSAITADGTRVTKTDLGDHDGGIFPLGTTQGRSFVLHTVYDSANQPSANFFASLGDGNLEDIKEIPGPIVPIACCDHEPIYSIYHSKEERYTYHRMTDADLSDVDAPPAFAARPPSLITKNGWLGPDDLLDSHAQSVPSNSGIETHGSIALVYGVNAEGSLVVTAFDTTSMRVLLTHTDNIWGSFLARDTGALTLIGSDVTKEITA